MKRIVIISAVILFSCSGEDHPKESELVEESNIEQEITPEIEEDEPLDTFLIELDCDTVWPGQHFSIRMHILDETSKWIPKNTKFEFLKRNKVVFEDSIYSEIGWVEYEDLNGDGTLDILVHHMSGARSINQHWNIFLVDPKTYELTYVLNSTEVCNPSWDAEKELIRSFGVAAEYYHHYFQLNEDRIGDMQISVVEQDPYIGGDADMLEAALDSATSLFTNGNYELEVWTEKARYDEYQCYSFPFIKGPNKHICDKINKMNAKRHLYVDSDTIHESIFEGIWKRPDEYSHVVGYTQFNVFRFDKKVFNLDFGGEGCGAYCEPFEITSSYDMRTGELILLKELFTARGQKELIKKLGRKKQEAIDQEVRSLKEQLKKKDIDDNLKRHYRESIEMYESCYISDDVESLGYYNFMPMNGYLTVRLDRCSAHANRNLDELGDFEFSFNLEEIEHLLSDYGKDILSE